MGARLRKAIVGVLVAGFLAVLLFGRAMFGAASGAVVMVGAFVAGFAWLWLLVAPWAVEGRTRPRR